MLAAVPDTSIKVFDSLELVTRNSAEPALVTVTSPALEMTIFAAVALLVQNARLPTARTAKSVTAPVSPADNAFPEPK